VIPKPVRESLNLKRGTEFHVRLDGDRIILEPLGPSAVEALYGKYADADLLSELEREHRQEMKDEATLRP
jgi:AbrB family looped-hinge helix DNA binding protein